MKYTEYTSVIMNYEYAQRQIQDVTYKHTQSLGNVFVMSKIMTDKLGRREHLWDFAKA